MSKQVVPFIKTKDADTKEQLLKEGFQLVSEQGGVWTFINDPKKSVAGFAKKNLTYSANLEF